MPAVHRQNDNIFRNNINVIFQIYRFWFNIYRICWSHTNSFDVFERHVIIKDHAEIQNEFENNSCNSMFIVMTNLY